MYRSEKQMPGLTLYFYDESVYASGRSGDGRAVAMLVDAPLFKHDFLVDEVTLVSSAEELAATATRPSRAPSDDAGAASAATAAAPTLVAPVAAHTLVAPAATAATRYTAAPADAATSYTNEAKDSGSVAPTADAYAGGDFASTSRTLTACLVVLRQWGTSGARQD